MNLIAAESKMENKSVREVAEKAARDFAWHGHGRLARTASKKMVTSIMV